VAPLDFLLTEWREGANGALPMDIRHGMFCVGCCAMIMVLLFVSGVMNLFCVAALAAMVLIEKLAPANHFVSSLFGLVLIASGVVLWFVQLLVKSQ
jgi:predicted metal-binding membrane protein